MPKTLSSRCGKTLALFVLAVAVALIFSGTNGSARAQFSPAAGSTYYVSPDGSDTAAGTEEAPFRTIQRAASLVDAGDTVVVRAGRYAGFQLCWDFPQNGTVSQPITFLADSGVVIEGCNDETADGINLEESSYVVIDGFTVDNASRNIDRACIRTVSRRNVIVRNQRREQLRHIGYLHQPQPLRAQLKATRPASTTPSSQIITVSTSPTPP
jgi:hypothetical protein